MNGSEKNSVAICLITNRRLTGLFCFAGDPWTFSLDLLTDVSGGF